MQQPSLALLIVQAYSRTMAAFGADDPDTHIAATNLAISLSRMGRHAEAGTVGARFTRSSTPHAVAGVRDGPSKLLDEFRGFRCRGAAAPGAGWALRNDGRGAPQHARGGQPLGQFDVAAHAGAAHPLPPPPAALHAMPAIAGRMGPDRFGRTRLVGRAELRQSA